ncbi:MAG: anthranilate synthase component I [Atribacterota bacterium]|nr:anthranilate synthase component I [Atribacterota bacterium]
MKEKVYLPDKENLFNTSEDLNLLIVYHKMLADTETPISVFEKVGQSGFSYLLESAEGGDKLARYSFIGINPFLVFQSKGKNITIHKEKKTENHTGNPFDILRQTMNNFKTKLPIEGLPRFFGGGVGYFGYDMIRFIEDIPHSTKDDLNIPDCLLMYAGIIIVFDHLTHQMWIIANTSFDKDIFPKEEAYLDSTNRIDRIISKLNNHDSEFRPENKSAVNGIKGDPSKLKTNSNLKKEEFIKKVEKAREYIKQGDAFQIVLSQRLNRKITEDPFKIYRSLRSLNPSPYMYYLNYGDIQIVGASPEPLVRLTEDLVESKPLAGTRHRGINIQEDLALEKDLLADEKEKAEHTMLVDLARNDLGRICIPGSVQVSQYLKVEKFSHVMHLVSEVQGIIEKKKDALDALEACFPAGTVSGAPKIRAIEIIDELEENDRGPYAGAVGYLGFNGNMDTCITIRTIVFKNNEAYIQAGAGIVYDSIPEKEYQETLNKAQALFKAIELAENDK